MSGETFQFTTPFFEKKICPEIWARKNNFTPYCFSDTSSQLDDSTIDVRPDGSGVWALQLNRQAGQVAGSWILDNRTQEKSHTKTFKYCFGLVFRSQ